VELKVAAGVVTDFIRFINQITYREIDIYISHHLMPKPESFDSYPCSIKSNEGSGYRTS